MRDLERGEEKQVGWSKGQLGRGTQGGCTAPVAVTPGVGVCKGWLGVQRGCRGDTAQARG